MTEKKRPTFTRPRQPVGAPLFRRVCAMALCGRALGVAAVITHSIARPPFPRDPERMALAPTLVVASAAAVAGFVVAVILMRLVTSDFVDANHYRGRNPVVWQLIGF